MTQIKEKPIQPPIQYDAYDQKMRHTFHGLNKKDFTIYVRELGFKSIIRSSNNSGNWSFRLTDDLENEKLRLIVNEGHINYLKYMRSQNEQ